MSRCEHSWTGRLVISLQLLAWCTVGGLLLHKGYSSIRQDVNRPYSSTVHYTNHSAQSINTSVLGDRSTTLITDKQVLKLAGKTVLIDTQVGNRGDRNSSNSLEKQTSDFITSEVNTTETVGDALHVTPPLSHQTPHLTHNVRVPTPARKRKYDLTLSGVVMTALGAIMLVVGPSVVILKCCDSDTNGARFDKLSADDPALTLADRDLPPTYEQASCIAPSYSTIFPEPETTRSNH